MPEAVKLQIERIVNDILETIDREREREIIARRFGLFDRKETLEQIGELLGITRERVRQLEKAVGHQVEPLLAETTRPRSAAVMPAPMSPMLPRRRPRYFDETNTSTP